MSKATLEKVGEKRHIEQLLWYLREIELLHEKIVGK